MEKNSKIYLAGHTGLVGSAIMRRLTSAGFTNIITRDISKLDLTRQAEAETFFAEHKPEYVFLAAARVGGIHANNTFPAEFIYQNVMIEANVIHSAYKYGVKKLLFLGSSCIYPKLAPQPMKEEHLLTGLLESTNEAYAIAKITGIELCKFYRRQYGCNFISAMPTNLYGINDNFDLNTSHVLPALIRKFHEAKISREKEVVIWGSGKPRREFLFVDDLADALLFLMQNYNEESHINIGTGEDIEIIELAKLIQKIVGFKGEIKRDLSKPDGTPRKLMDVSRLHALGWKHGTAMEEGIRSVYEWYNQNTK
jgi:GDP-L-fucose synthase